MAQQPKVVDYASLTSYLVDIFDRSTDTDFTNRTDIFIGLAEDTWTPSLLSRKMEATASLTTASDGTVALPADFYRMRSLGGPINGAGTNLPMIGPTAQFGLYPIATGDGSTNVQLMNDTLITVPANAGLVLTLDYWAMFVGLSASNTTNWIITNYPTLYLFSAMAQAAFWLEDYDKAQSLNGLASDYADTITSKLGQDYYQNTDLVLDSPTP